MQRRSGIIFLIASYILFGAVIGFMLWNKLANEDIVRCLELSICQKQYLFIWPFSLIFWPLVTFATIIFEPVGFVALFGLLVFGWMLIGNKRNSLIPISNRKMNK